MPTGVTYTDLMLTIKWTDERTRSEAEVHTMSSGYVALVATRVRGGWRWMAYGWLGVCLWRGQNFYRRRQEAKRAAVTWWGSKTIADRTEQKGGRSGILEGSDGEAAKERVGAMVGGQGEKGRQGDADADAAAAVAAAHPGPGAGDLA